MLARRHFRRAARSSPSGLLKFAAITAVRRCRDAIERRQAEWAPTYADEDVRVVSLFDRPLSGDGQSLPDQVLSNWKAHRFDILGCGWTESPSPGQQVGGANAATADRIRNLLPADYQPIDWHRDLKSGHCWDAGQWHRHVPIPVGQGIDIKSPWELARCHHLPAMALAATANEDASLAIEVRAQILDFIASNPPKQGVNWRCTMDVAIRAANWVVTESILRDGSLPAASSEIADINANSLLDHGRFIAGHLEWYPDRTGNHYLANIAGLAFVATALDPENNDEAAGWLQLSTRELERETAVQFLADGGHFEGSVAYHRLCLEMAVWGTAACLRAGARFTAGHFQRLALATGFLQAAVKPSGGFVQIGDNDSGRFLNLCPRFDADLRECQLDPSATINAALALLGQKGRANNVDAQVMSALAAPVVTPLPPIASGYGTASGPPASGNQLVLNYGPGLDEGIESLAFPEFGLFIIRSKRLWLSIRCGGESDPIGAHRHNDQLAIELTVDGEDIIRDPGTYSYTPDPVARNAYRSVAAHFAPQTAGGREPASLEAGLFFLDPPMRGECLSFNSGQFTGHHHGFGAEVVRSVEIKADRIIICDKATDSVLLRATVMPVEGPAFSSGYGRRD